MPVLLDNPIQTYPWGSPTVIPQMLGVPATDEPQAELWVGAHPVAPSRVERDDADVGLPEFISDDPEGTLGSAVLRRFGPRLPYLLKILAVDQPLSIQAHPSAEQARAGYDAEEAAGVPSDAADRSYKDPWPKPEIIVALTGFEALLGFRDPQRTAELLGGLGVPELSDAVAALRRGTAGLEELVRHWLQLPPPDAARLVAAVERRARTARDPLCRLVTRLAAQYPGDRGVLLAMLLRHERLAPGEAAFTPAGMPHAYLRGVAVEAQASSDNTLRAGLTAKHVDTEGLLEILRYHPEAVTRILPAEAAPRHEVYATPAEEFRLSRLALDGQPVDVGGAGPRVVLLTDGTATLTAGATQVKLGPGRAAFVPAAERDGTLEGEGIAFVVAPGLEAG